MTNPAPPDSTPFVLAPPEHIALPTPAQARSPITAISPEVVSQVGGRVDDFIGRLCQADLKSDQFREMMDRAFSVGRKEVADAGSFLNSDPLMRQATFKDFSDSNEAKAIGELSSILAKANPKGQDLLGPVKVLGIPMPFGNKIRDYFDNFKSMGQRITELSQVLEEEEDAMLREIAGYDLTETKLYELLGRLDRATAFLSELDLRTEQTAADLQASDPEKARALREEVLYFVRGNLSDVIQYKVLITGAIGQNRQLRHTGRMTMRGTNRVRTLGMAALSIAQRMAIATYNQKKRLDMNLKAQQVVNDVIGSVGDAILDHTRAAIDFESNPMLGMEALENSINKTIEAVNVYNNFRLTAVQTMKADNEKLVALADKARVGMRIDDVRVLQNDKSGKYGDVLSI